MRRAFSVIVSARTTTGITFSSLMERRVRLLYCANSCKAPKVFARTWKNINHHQPKITRVSSNTRRVQKTCTVLNLLFHWFPLICTSIVFRDRVIVMWQTLLFSQLVKNNLSNKCKSARRVRRDYSFSINYNISHSSHRKREGTGTPQLLLRSLHMRTRHGIEHLNINPALSQLKSD